MVVDLREFVRPGDTILWGQGTGEPLTLTEALVEQRASLGGATVFLGSAFSTTLEPAHADHLRLVGIGGIGTNAPLFRAGALDILPCHISSVPRLIENGDLRVDVVFVQVSPADADGRFSLGLVADYMGAAIARARTVVAEVNDQIPRTYGDTLVGPDQIHHVVETSRPPLSLPPQPPKAVERAIAEHVAALVPDGGVLQLGLGSVSDAIAAALAVKRDLGVHSGMVGDWLVDLIEAGAVTNARKSLDRGVTITGALFGTRRLYDFAHENPELMLRPISYTHDVETLGRIERLVAINSAVEVDLTGQVNAETVAGRHVGAVGGQVDFMRGAMRAPEGRSVIALPATAKRGEISRIVGRLADAITTTPRSDVDFVVTEHGAANLRGAPLPERARRLAAIAGPAFRERLADQARTLC
jgi:acetyl-CoA hydrolase